MVVGTANNRTMMNQKQSSTDVPWWWNGKALIGSDDPRIPLHAIGFVYRICRYESKEYRQNADRGWNPSWEKIYIGKKLLHTNRKGRVSKKEIKDTGTRKRVKRIIKNSGWMSYNSSCPEVQKDLQEHPELMRKEIIEWCWSKKHLSYCEMEHQVREDVLRKDAYNGNILSRFFKRDLVKPITK